jgi:hypothetical protein
MAKAKKMVMEEMNVEKKMAAAMAAKAPVMVTYQGEKDESPRVRVTFFLTPVELSKLGPGANVYTQVDGKHPWAFRRFAAAHISNISRVPPEIDRAELAREQAHLRAMLPSLFRSA